MNATNGKWVLRLIEVLPDSDMYSMGIREFNKKPTTEDIIKYVNEVKAPRYELVGLVEGEIKITMEDMSPIVGDNFTITASRFYEDADQRTISVRGVFDNIPFSYFVACYEETGELIERNSFTEVEDFERAEELENLIGHFFENNTYAYITDMITKKLTESDSK